MSRIQPIISEFPSHSQPNTVPHSRTLAKVCGQVKSVPGHCSRPRTNKHQVASSPRTFCYHLCSRSRSFKRQGGELLLSESSSNSKEVPVVCDWHYGPAAGGTLLNPNSLHHQRLRTPRASSESLKGGKEETSKSTLTGFNRYLITLAAQGPKNMELAPYQEPSVTMLVLVQEASKSREEQINSTDSQFSAKSYSLEPLQSSTAPTPCVCPLLAEPWE